MLVNVNGIYYVHVCDWTSASRTRSAGNSALENVCMYHVYVCMYVLLLLLYLLCKFSFSCVIIYTTQIVLPLVRSSTPPHPPSTFLCVCMAVTCDYLVLSMLLTFICLCITYRCHMKPEPDSPGSTICADSVLFRYPFHPRVTAVARKRSQSFCQKCRWQVTVKHAYTLRMWLCMKWHGAWLAVCTELAPKRLQFHVAPAMPAAVSTPLRWIFKNAL